MKEPSVLQDYPAWIIALSNGLTLSIYALGAAIVNVHRKLDLLDLRLGGSFACDLRSAGLIDRNGLVITHSAGGLSTSLRVRQNSCHRSVVPLTWVQGVGRVRTRRVGIKERRNHLSELCQSAKESERC